MNRWLAPGVGGCAAAVILTALWEAGAQTPSTAASAASVSKGEDWGTPDGGAVVIKPGGKLFSILCDDITNKTSIFSEGRVVSETGPMDGEHSYKLSATTPGQVGWRFEVLAHPDGTGELWFTRGKDHHLVAKLKK
jgi:hypothetical protein